MTRFLDERIAIVRQQRQEAQQAQQELEREQQAEHPILRVGRLAREVAALAVASSLPVEVEMTVTKPIMEEQQKRFSNKTKKVQVGVERKVFSGWDVEHEIKGLDGGIARDGSKALPNHHLRGKLLTTDGKLYEYSTKPVNEDYQAMKQIFAPPVSVKFTTGHEQFTQEADGQAASRMTPEPAIELLLDKLAAFAVDRHLVD